MRTPSLPWNYVLPPALWVPSTCRARRSLRGRKPQATTPRRLHGPGSLTRLAVTTGRPQVQVCGYSSSCQAMCSVSGCREIRAGLTGSVNLLHGMRSTFISWPSTLSCEGPALPSFRVPGPPHGRRLRAAWRKKECFEVLFFLYCPSCFSGYKWPLVPSVRGQRLGTPAGPV